MSEVATEPTEHCDTCGKDIPAARFALHLSGLDDATPECPLTDIVEIAMRKRGEWDDMRRRFQNDIPIQTAIERLASLIRRQSAKIAQVSSKLPGPMP